MTDLGNIVVLAGSNGSGKSRVFKLLTQHIQSQIREERSEETIAQGEKANISMDVMGKNGQKKLSLAHWKDTEILNYSQYNQPLQRPGKFTPYVLEQTVQRLKSCDFETTAKDALLYLRYLSEISETAFLKENLETKDDHPVPCSEFQKFQKFLLEMSQLTLDRKVNEDKSIQTTLCGEALEHCHLSPGQQYLLRMSVALYCNQVAEKDFILLLDEPETHLHPEAMWKLVSHIQTHFNHGQIWIATHSIALLSQFDPSDIWHITPNKIRRLGSHSDVLIQRLVGEEERRRRFYQFISSPDWFACYEYCIECLMAPKVVETSPKNDPQITMATEGIQSKEGPIILDFGAGRGRFFHGLAMEYSHLLDSIHYLAYNQKPEHNCLFPQEGGDFPCLSCENQDSCESKTCLERIHGYGLPIEKHFFHDLEALQESYGGKIDEIFLLNVLHEIPPQGWSQIFREMAKLLKEDGRVNIIEVREFTYGEKAFQEGTFLVLQEEAVKKLNAFQLEGPKPRTETNPKHKATVNHIIPKRFLEKIDENMVKEMIEALKNQAISELSQLRQPPSTQTGLAPSKEGLRLVFWQQQFVEASFQLLQWPERKQS